MKPQYQERTMRPQQIVTHNNLLWLWALLLIIPLVIPTQASDTETVTGQLVFSCRRQCPQRSGPGDPSLSDPNEDGTSAHPYDDILEVLEALKDYDYPEPDDDYTIQIVVEPVCTRPRTSPTKSTWILLVVEEGQPHRKPCPGQFRSQRFLDRCSNPFRTSPFTWIREKRIGRFYTQGILLYGN